MSSQHTAVKGDMPSTTSQKLKKLLGVV